MTHKRNKFWTFLFSLVPGAGQMYMGFMKRGLSLMAPFCIFTALIAWLELGPLILIDLLFFAWSFFDSLNLSSLDDTAFAAVKDDWLFTAGSTEDFGRLYRSCRRWLAAALIVLGCFLLLRTTENMLRGILPISVLDSAVMQTIFQAFYQLPKILVSVAIIIIGVRMIRGHRSAASLPGEEDSDENQ